MTEESAMQITPIEASVLLSAAEWDPALFVKTLGRLGNHGARKGCASYA